jgi:hypothetical protein
LTFWGASGLWAVAPRPVLWDLAYSAAWRVTLSAAKTTATTTADAAAAAATGGATGGATGDAVAAAARCQAALCAHCCSLPHWQQLVVLAGYCSVRTVMLASRCCAVFALNGSCFMNACLEHVTGL